MARPDILVHECCHVWQYQHRGTRYASDAVWATVVNPDPYDWQVEIANGRTTWQELNGEAEAQFLQDIWTQGTSEVVAGAPALIGDGVFYADDPIGPDVEFVPQTSLAIEAITYVRAQFNFRLTSMFSAP